MVIDGSGRAKLCDFGLACIKTASLSSSQFRKEVSERRIGGRQSAVGGRPRRCKWYARDPTKGAAPKMINQL